jgi:acyl-CoA synthetase (AMP-forming)/AMP-acid ligase II
MAAQKLILDYIYEHETEAADRVYLTQPVGGGRVIDYTWAQVMDQARRMAAHLKNQGFEPGARIAILSKNCAHFIMAELAIWMAGGTTVAIFPTEPPTPCASCSSTARRGCCSSASSTPGRTRRRACRPGAAHRLPAGAAHRLRHLGRRLRAHAAAGRPARGARRTTWRC